MAPHLKKRGWLVRLLHRAAWTAIRPLDWRHAGDDTGLLEKQPDHHDDRDDHEDPDHVDAQLERRDETLLRVVHRIRAGQVHGGHQHGGNVWARIALLGFVVLQNHEAGFDIPRLSP